jgi:hypothetical protein
MRIGYTLLALAFAGAGFADTLTLRDGRVVNGTYLGGTARQIRMEVADRVENFDTGNVSSLEFTHPAVSSPAPAPAPAPAAEVEPEKPLIRRADNVLRPEPAPAAATPAPANVELPAGTNFVVRMIDGIDSETNRVGETFNGSLDEPVVIGGNQVIPRGADVIVKLVNDKESGKLTGRAELALDLVSVRVNGRMLDLNTQSVTRASESRGTQTAKMATGGAALGAIIGAIAGGGRGAAIGAASGAGAGTAVQVVTKGQKVRIPSETRLSFVLDVPVKL